MAGENLRKRHEKLDILLIERLKTKIKHRNWEREKYRLGGPYNIKSYQNFFHFRMKKSLKAIMKGGTLSWSSRPGSETFPPAGKTAHPWVQGAGGAGHGWRGSSLLHLSACLSQIRIIIFILYTNLHLCT